MHKFEASGLGAAPYTFEGCSEQVYQACPGAPIQPGSSCDYCGQGIRYVFWFKSADTKRFKVGSDCFYSAMSEEADVANSPEKKLQLTVKKAHRAMMKKLQDEGLAVRVSRTKAQLIANPTLLADRPHPNEYSARAGKTLRDYVEWMLLHGGVVGRTKACRTVARG
jgi:hypothetical protein